MYKLLNTSERSELLIRHKKERDGRIKDRIKAVLLHDDGWSPPKIAAALFIDEGTVRDHINIYQEEKRLTGNHKGSEPFLNKEESKSLSEHLESKTYVKIKDIQAYVEQTFQKKLGRSTLYDWLKAHNFSYKKPKLVPKNVNPALQEEFIELYEKLM